MSFEESLAVTLRSQIGPVLDELRSMKAELAAMRRALPPLQLTPAEAALAFRTSVSTIRRRMRDGSLPITRATGNPRVDINAMAPPAEAEVIRIALELRRIEPAEGDDE